jgi:hypothetical protein
MLQCSLNFNTPNQTPVSCLLRCLRVSRRSYAHAMPTQRQSRDHAAHAVEKICNTQCRSVRRPAYVTARTCGRTGAPRRTPRPTVSWPPSSTPRIPSLPANACFPPLPRICKAKAEARLGVGEQEEIGREDEEDGLGSKPSVTCHGGYPF